MLGPALVYFPFLEELVIRNVIFYNENLLELPILFLNRTSFQ